MPTQHRAPSTRRRLALVAAGMVTVAVLALSITPFAVAMPLQVVPPAKPPAPPAPPATAPPAKSGSRVVPSENFPDDPRIDSVVRKLLASNQFESARIVLKAILEKRPDLGRAQFFMGVTLSKMKQYQQARPFFESAIKGEQLFPERKHAQHFMGWASYHLGELDRAKAEFLQHLALVPDEPDSIFALGIIAFDNDDLDEAEARFTKAIELQPGPTANKRDVAKAWARLGDVSVRRDASATAEEQFVKSLTLYPDHYEVWAKLARVRDRMGKALEAESAREEEQHAKERVAKRGVDPDDVAPPPLLKKDEPVTPPKPAPPNNAPAQPPAAQPSK